MSRGKAEGGQANEADFATNGSKPDIKYWCKHLIGFIIFNVSEFCSHQPLVSKSVHHIQDATNVDVPITGGALRGRQMLRFLVAPFATTL